MWDALESSDGGRSGGSGGSGGSLDGGVGLSALDQQARAMLEKTLAARGAVFLGTPFSTFTAHIARMRRQFGTASDLDGFLCHPAVVGGGGSGVGGGVGGVGGAGVGGGGVRSGLRFDHPGKWGVVWSNATSLLGDRRDDLTPMPDPVPNKTPARTQSQSQNTQKMSMPPLPF